MESLTKLKVSTCANLFQVERALFEVETWNITPIERIFNLFQLIQKNIQYSYAGGLII